MDQLTFEQKRAVLDVLQAEFTLEKDGQLRILLVLPSTADGSYVQHNHTNVRHASACMFQDQGIEALASILLQTRPEGPSDFEPFEMTTLHASESGVALTDFNTRFEGAERN